MPRAPKQTTTVDPFAQMVAANNHASNPDLIKGGEPNPAAIFRNRLKYGYTCPRAEYVESLIAPTIRDLAKKWGVAQRTIESWKHKEKWDEERIRQNQELARRRRELDIDALADTQMQEVQDQRRMAKTIRDALIGALERGTITEQSATGSVNVREFNFDDYKKAAQTMDVLNKTIERNLGMSELIKPGGTKVNELPPVTRVVMNLDFTSAEKRAANIIEGEFHSIPELPSPSPEDTSSKEQ